MTTRCSAGLSLMLLSIVLAGCRKEVPAVESEGPVLGMTVAGAVDDKGHPQNPGFTFPPTEPQLVVLVQMGKIDAASPLNVVWYRMSDDGDQKLFEHQIAVKSYDRAFSTGKSQGALEAGSYKVTASLGGQTRDAVVDIRAPKPAAQSAGAPPLPGASGTIPQQAATQAASDAGCRILLEGEDGDPVDTSAGRILLSTDSSCTEGAIFQVKATVAGPVRFVGGQFSAGKAIFPVDPCDLSGGSDLPDTKVKFSARVESRKDVPDAAVTVTLGPDTLAPLLKVDSNPKKGTKRKAGDTIEVTVTAREKKEGGPWQTGVKKITVLDVHGPVVGKPLVVPGKAKPCGSKSWEQTYVTTYTVPEKPPAVIDLCAIAEDFAGNQSSKCAEFPTGDVWSGTLRVETASNYPTAGGCVGETWELDIRLVVGGDGSVKGTTKGRLTSMPRCAGLGFLNHDYSRQAKTTAHEVTGTFDGRRFALIFAQTEADGSTDGLLNYSLGLSPSVGAQPTVVLKLSSPTAARGDTTTHVLVPNSVGVTADGKIAFDLKCETCAPRVATLPTSAPAAPSPAPRLARGSPESPSTPTRPGGGAGRG